MTLRAAERRYLSPARLSLAIDRLIAEAQHDLAREAPRATSGAQSKNHTHASAGSPIRYAAHQAHGGDAGARQICRPASRRRPAHAAG